MCCDCVILGPHLHHPSLAAGGLCGGHGQERGYWCSQDSSLACQECFIFGRCRGHGAVKVDGGQDRVDQQVEEVGEKFGSQEERMQSSDDEDYVTMIDLSLEPPSPVAKSVPLCEPAASHRPASQPPAPLTSALWDIPVHREGTSRPGGGDRRPGDWLCHNTNCANINFAWRHLCHLCGTVKEELKGQSGPVILPSATPQQRPGDLRQRLRQLEHQYKQGLAGVQNTPKERKEDSQLWKQKSGERTNQVECFSSGINGDLPPVPL